MSNETMPDQSFLKEVIKDDQQRITSLTVQSAGLLVLTNDPAVTGRVMAVPSTADVTVYADVLRIRGPLMLPGRTVRLYARRLETEMDSQRQGAAIIVDGADGASAPPWQMPHARDGKPGLPGSPGQRGGDGESAPPANVAEVIQSYDSRIAQLDGPILAMTRASLEMSKSIIMQLWDRSKDMAGMPGQDGDPGKPGGTIVIACETLAADAPLVLRAAGGRGGDGQAGQGGGRGGDGAPGADAPADGSRVGTDGGNGGNGGSGGNGGKAGRGGNGGKIVVQSVHPVDARQLSAVVAGGSPGKPGKGGLGGGCGYGARGGQGTIAVFDIGGRTLSKRIPGGNHGSNGQVGAHGADGQGPGQAAPSGTYTQTTCAYEDIAPLLPDSSLQMLFERARASYLAAGDDGAAASMAEAVRLLAWVNALATADSTARPSNLRRAIYQQSQLLSIFLQRGWNYFGHEVNYVPAGTREYWLQEVQESLGELQDIEAQYVSYCAAAQTLSEQQHELQGALKASYHLQTELQDTMTSLAPQLTAKASLIGQLEDQAQGAAATLQSRLATLEAAIQAAVGLSWKDFAAVLQNLAFISEQPFQGTAMILSQAGNLASTAMNTIVNDAGQNVSRQYLVNKLALLGQDFQNLNEGYALVNGYLTTDDPNGGKLLYERQQLQNLLDQIASWQEAQAVRQQLEDYINLENARNQAILAYNALVAQVVTAHNQLMAEQHRYAQVQAQLTDNADPALPAFTTFLASAYEQIKARCLYNLYMATRAAVFWSLDPTITLQSIFGVEDVGQITTAMIATNQSLLEQKLSRAHEQFSQDAQAFRNVELVIDETTSPHIMQALRAGKSTGLALTLPVVMPGTDAAASPFAGMADVRVTMVQAWIDGIRTTNGKYQVEIAHLGREQLVTPEGTLMEVVHAPKHFKFRYDPEVMTDHDTSDPEEAEGSSYAAIGPFATWQIDIRPQYNLGLDLSGLQQIRLVFAGTCRAFTVAPA